MGHQTEIGKTHCFFCGKSVSRNGFGFTSHMRKHVREGIALEIGPNHHKYRGCIEFINLLRYAKIGTVTANIVLNEFSYSPKAGHKIRFRHNTENIWLDGIVDDINENFIFITLL